MDLRTNVLDPKIKNKSTYLRDKIFLINTFFDVKF